MRVFILSSERRPLTEQKKRERKVDINGDRYEQVFLVQTINALEKTRQWESMAIVIAFDDSDGDYDHQMSPIFNGSYRATRCAKRDGYLRIRRPFARRLRNDAANRSCNFRPECAMASSGWRAA